MVDDDLQLTFDMEHWNSIRPDFDGRQERVTPKQLSYVFFHRALAATRAISARRSGPGPLS